MARPSVKTLKLRQAVAEARRLRRENTRKAVAHRLGVSIATVQRIELELEQQKVLS